MMLVEQIYYEKKKKEKKEMKEWNFLFI